MKIGDKVISKSSPVFVIAEVGQAHDGSLGQAHAYIDAIAKTGADAVKFQTHIADAESSEEEIFRINFSYEDKSRYDYWKRMEFSSDQWAGLKDHAEGKDLVFLSSPFSFEAVKLLNDLSIQAWKIASGEVDNLAMIKAMAESGKPLLLSSGLSSWSELDKTVQFIQNLGNELAIFQCTTAYPCRPEEVGLNIIQEIQERFNCPTGISDHSGNIFSSLASVALGADIVEIHTVFSKDSFGPDTNASITIKELHKLVEGCRNIRSSLQNPICKNTFAKKNNSLKETFGKSLFAANNIPAGTFLKFDDIALKKPGTGIKSKYLNNYLGRKIKHAITKNHKFSDVDFE